MNNNPHGHTVILAYPSECVDETYIEYSTSPDPQQAAKDVQRMASDANGGEYEPDDFHVIAVFQGNHDPVWSSIHDQG